MEYRKISLDKYTAAGVKIVLFKYHTSYEKNYLEYESSQEEERLQKEEEMKKLLTDEAE